MEQQLCVYVCVWGVALVHIYTLNFALLGRNAVCYLPSQSAMCESKRSGEKRRILAFALAHSLVGRETWRHLLTRLSHSELFVFFLCIF